MAVDTTVWGDDDALVRLLACADSSSLLAAAAAAVLPEDAPSVAAFYRQHPDGRLTLQGTLGFSDLACSEFGTLSVETDLPAAQAVRERSPVFSPAPDFPHAVLESTGRLQEAGSEYVSLPLTADGDCLGVLVLLLPPRWATAGANLARLRAVATVCAHRWQRLLAVDDGEGLTRSGAQAPADGAPGAAASVALTTARGRVSLLDLAMTNAGIGTFDWDFTTGRLVWDERLCDLFGIAPGDFDGRIDTAFAAIHPEDRPRVEQAVEESHRTGSYHVVSRIVRPDGSVRWIDAESRVVYLHSGEPKGMIGVAQDRTEEAERESARRSRSEFVINLTSGLAAAVTTDDIVTTLVERAVPALGARWLTVYLQQEHGPMRLIGSVGFDDADRQHVEWAAHRAHDHPLLAPVHEGHPMFLESRSEWATRMPGGDLAPPPDQHAWALLPMTSAHGLVGLCSLIFDRPRVFTSDDRTVLTAAAGLLGQAMARAGLQDTRRRYLTELQRLMLPVRLPTVPGLDISVSYRPGSEGLEVGGDWYDVVPVSGGRVALIIGDVQGHNVQAAGVMGQLRTAMRAHAADGHGPADLLARGHHALAELDTELFATCCIAEVDPRTGRVRLARAGHPYPLLVDAAGRVRELAAPGGIPLGTFDGEDGADAYVVTEAELPPGGALLLYTDGLVERPGADYADGVADLCERLAWWAAAPGPAPDTEPGAPPPRDAEGAVSRDFARDLDGVVERITEPAVSRPRHDDIAVLLVRMAS